MIDGFNNHNDMIGSICDAFVNSVNDTVPDDIELLCNQDGYEILSDIFGQAFRKCDIERVTIEQLLIIASDLGEFLEREVTAEEVCGFINTALEQSFGEFNSVNVRS